MDATASKTSAVGEEEDEEEDDRTVGLALHGSLGPKFNGDSDLFYSQFELHSREQKMIQITLIKVAVFSSNYINQRFPTLFDAFLLYTFLKPLIPHSFRYIKNYNTVFFGVRLSLFDAVPT